MDYESFSSFASLPVTPHVLIIPSELRYFVKVLTSRKSPPLNPPAPPQAMRILGHPSHVMNGVLWAPQGSNQRSSNTTPPHPRIAAGVGGEGGLWVPMEPPNVCRDPTGGVGLRLHQPRAADQGTGSGDLRAAVPAATVGWRAEEPLRGCPGGQDLGSHRPDPKKSPEFGVCGGGFPPSRVRIWGFGDRISPIQTPIIAGLGFLDGFHRFLPQSAIRKPPKWAI